MKARGHADEIADRTRRTCDLYRRAIAAGENSTDVIGALAALDGVQRPAIFRRLQRGGVLQRKSAPPRPPGAKAPALQGAAKLQAAPPPVYRDPCPRCNVRGDIGCKHGNAANGWAG